MFQAPYAIWKISIAAVVLRLLFLVVILFVLGQGALFMGDSEGYLRVAKNIVLGHGLTGSEAPPFLPDARFPPLYLLLLGASLFISGSVIPLIVFQAVLASFLPLAVYRMGSFFTDREDVLWWASFLTAFEPLMVIFSVLVIPHVIDFAFILGSSVCFLLWMREGRMKFLGISGGLLGLAALTRPHAKFLPLLVLLFFLCAFIWNRNKKILLSASLFLAVFLVVVSPWAVRNYSHFGTPSLSSTGLRNVYTDFAVSLLEYKTGKSYSEVESELESAFASKKGITTSEIQSNPLYARELAYEGLKIVWENKAGGIIVLLINSFAFLTQDLYFYFAGHYQFIKDVILGFSPSLVLVQEGPLPLIKKVWQEAGPSLFISFVGRGVWVSIFLAAVWGVYRAFKNRDVPKYAIFVLLALIGYYWATSMVSGFSAYGFHRYPVNAFLFLLASYGGFHIYGAISNYWRGSEAKKTAV